MKTFSSNNIISLKFEYTIKEAKTNEQINDYKVLKPSRLNLIRYNHLSNYRAFE